MSLERGQAICSQLSGKKELLKERWAEQLSRRVNKDLKKDELYDMV